MAESVLNLVLEQLRGIRESLGGLASRMDGLASDIQDLKTGQQAQTGVLMALAGYIRDVDMRVERLEEKIGGA